MTLKIETDKENLFRIHLREEFVDTGFIDVHQWRNFSDYFKIELNKIRKELIEEFKKMIDEINIRRIGFEKMTNKQQTIDNFIIELKILLKELEKKQ